MSLLFTPGQIGALNLPNRLVRSATAERMSDAEGRPTPRLESFYQELARGGVGLIITGHLYIHPSGKCHPEMTGAYDDALVPALSQWVEAIHAAGGLVAAQINHGGMQCSRETVAQTMAPSEITAPFLQGPAREMTQDEILGMIDAYGQAARRVQEAGFDGVQIHGAHGYLISQFLSPYSNRRQDAWGGDLERRTRFLRQVCQAVRQQVGPDYPVFIKLGMVDGLDEGLSLQEGVEIVSMLEGMGLDGIEISGGIQSESSRANPQAPYFRPLVQAARPATGLPLLIVGGLRSRQSMEEILAAGEADFISLCRPLICEPDLPARLRAGQARAQCISCNRCGAKGYDEGISCKQEIDDQDVS